jgi:tRNA G18 (ribose-2'-O)-methylase SpoU
MNDPSVLAAQTGGVALEGGEPEFLLYGLQSPINIGMILRVAETYQFRVSIYDRHNVLEDAGKLETIADFSCGALSRRGFRKLEHYAGLAVMLEGRRLVATSIDRGSVSLPEYRFQAADVFALGNEYDGLPEDMLSRADLVLNIPMPQVWTPKPKSHNPIDPVRSKAVARDGQANLNVAMSAAIICYATFTGGLGCAAATTAVDARASR